MQVIKDLCNLLNGRISRIYMFNSKININYQINAASKDLKSKGRYPLVQIQFSRATYRCTSHGCMGDSGGIITLLFRLPYSYSMREQRSECSSLKVLLLFGAKRTSLNNVLVLFLSCTFTLLSEYQSPVEYDSNLSLMCY